MCDLKANITINRKLINLINSRGVVSNQKSVSGPVTLMHYSKLIKILSVFFC